MRNAKKAGLTTRKAGKKILGMLQAMKYSLRDVESSYDEENREDEAADEDDTELGNLSNEDKPSIVIGTNSTTVQYLMVTFWQWQIRLVKFTAPAWGDVAHYFGDSEMKYGTAKLMILAVVKLQPNMTAVAPSPTTVGKLMQNLAIIPGQS